MMNLNEVTRETTIALTKLASAAVVNLKTYEVHETLLKSPEIRKLCTLNNFDDWKQRNNRMPRGLLQASFDRLMMEDG